MLKWMNKRIGEDDFHLIDQRSTTMSHSDTQHSTAVLLNKTEGLFFNNEMSVLGPRRMFVVLGLFGDNDVLLEEELQRDLISEAPLLTYQFRTLKTSMPGKY